MVETKQGENEIKMMKFNRVILLLFVLFLLFASLSFALSTHSHEVINEHVARTDMNGFSLDSFLRVQLGFQEGIYEEFNLNEIHKVFEWVGIGGKYEDKPPGSIAYQRSINHFHNPLTDLGHIGMSSTLWALLPQGEQSTFCSWTGCYSWNDVREYYYQALTAVNQSDRNTYFAETFRGVGQLMHLIHDASVPSHTREDIHLCCDYEDWVGELEEADIEAYNPIFFTGGIDDIASFIETGQYIEPNPDPNVAVGTNIGLSEYTNANFFSNDTINSSNFPYPEITQDMPVIEEMITNPLWNSTYTRQYYLKDCCGETNGGQGYLLSAVDYFDYHRKQNPLLIGDQEQIPVLDGYVYEEYADFLIPRAVGYSAGLLNYFFRGELYVAFLVPSVDEISLGFGNKNDTGSDIDRVGVHIQSNSKLNGVIEPVGAGTLTLTVSYKDSSDSIIYESAGSVSVTSIPDVESTSYIANVFILTNPIPTLTATDVTYYFVFRGQLGNEEDAVIGKVIKAPVLHSVSPDEGLLGDVVTLTGNNLPTIDGPFPTTSDDVRFSHSVTSLYEVEVINKTDTDITVKVPNTAGLNKPGYGGLRLRNVLDTGEKIYSNPVLFFPIAEGEVRNIGPSIINVTIAAIGPINGDYSQLPGTITIDSLGPGASEPIQLMTGFTYKATANTTVTKDIEFLTVDTTVFVFEVE